MGKNKNYKIEYDAEFDKLLVQLAIPMIYYVLKEFSSAEESLTAKDIARLANELVDFSDEIVFKEGLIKSKLNSLVAYALTGEDYDGLSGELMSVKNFLHNTFGGVIVEVKKDNPLFPKKKPHSTYYFQPLLDNSDIDMISGSIASNRFFSAEEMNYLIARLEATGSRHLNAIPKNNSKYYRDRINNYILPDKPDESNADSIRTVHSTKAMLKNVSTLYKAITTGQRVKMVYARYKQSRESDNDTSIMFYPIHDGKEYILNPYATLWNDGHFYLIATEQGNPEQHKHYRIDRMYSVELLDEESEPLPKSLASYRLDRGNKERPVLDTSRYTKEHPTMAFTPNTEEMISCCIECSEVVLPILVDAFGTGLSIKPSPIEHKGDEKKYYFATIDQVHPTCIENYCTQYSYLMTPIYPVSLRENVIKVLKTQIEKLENTPKYNEEELL